MTNRNKIRLLHDCDYASSSLVAASTPLPHYPKAHFPQDQDQVQPRFQRNFCTVSPYGCHQGGTE